MTTKQEMADLDDEARALLDAQNKKGETPLHAALLAKNDDIARFLLSFGASVNIQTNEGKYPLDIALQSNKDEVIIDILKSGPSIDRAQSQKYLADAITQGKTPEILGLLIQHGADPNYSEGDTLPALFIVARNVMKHRDTWLDAATVLMQHGANPHFINAKTNQKWYESIANDEDRTRACSLSEKAWRASSHRDLGPFCHAALERFLLGLHRLAQTGLAPTLDTALIQEMFENLRLGDFPFAREALQYDERKRRH